MLAVHSSRRRRLKLQASGEMKILQFSPPPKSNGTGTLDPTLFYLAATSLSTVLPRDPSSVTYHASIGTFNDQHACLLLVGAKRCTHVHDNKGIGTWPGRSPEPLQLHPPLLGASTPVMLYRIGMTIRKHRYKLQRDLGGDLMESC